MSLRYQSGSLRIQRPTGIVRPIATPSQRAALKPTLGKHFPLFTNNRLTYHPVVELAAGTLPDKPFGKGGRRRYAVRPETTTDVQNFEFLRQNRIAESGASNPDLDGGGRVLPRDLFFRGGKRPDSAASAAFMARAGRDISANELRPGYNRRRALQAIEQEEARVRVPPPPQAPPLLFGLPAREPVEIPQTGAESIVIGPPQRDVELETGESYFGGPGPDLPVEADEDMGIVENVETGQGIPVPAPNRASLREAQPNRRLGIRSSKKNITIRRMGPSGLPFAAPMDASGEEVTAVPLFGDTGEGITDETAEAAFAGGSGSGGGAEVEPPSEAQNEDIANVFFTDPTAGYGVGFGKLPDPSPATLEITVSGPNAAPLQHSDLPERVVQLATMASNGYVEAVVPPADALNAIVPVDMVSITTAMPQAIDALREGQVVDVAEDHITYRTADGGSVTAYTSETAIGIVSSDTRPQIIEDVRAAQEEMDNYYNTQQAQPVHIEVLGQDAEQRREPAGPMTRADFKAMARNLITGLNVASQRGARALAEAQVSANLQAFSREVEITKANNREFVQRYLAQQEQKAIEQAKEERERLRYQQKKRKGKHDTQRGAGRKAGKGKGKDDGDPGQGPPPPPPAAGAVAVGNEIQEDADYDPLQKFVEAVAEKYGTVQPIQLGGVNAPVAFMPRQDISTDAANAAHIGMLGIVASAAKGSNSMVNRLAHEGNGIVTKASGAPLAVLPQSDRLEFSAPPVQPPTGPELLRRRAVESRSMAAFRSDIESLEYRLQTRASGRPQVRAARGQSIAEVTARIFKDRVAAARLQAQAARRDTLRAQHAAPQA